MTPRLRLTTLVLTLFFALFSPTFAQNEVSDARRDTMDETTFLDRTPEEYRRLILEAHNKAQIDAFICQMLVQEMRERGDNFSDNDFLNILESPEMRQERFKRFDYWTKERAKAEEEKGKIDYRTYGAALGGLAIILLVIVFVGRKRNPKIESSST